MYRNLQRKTSFSYVITYINLLSFVLFFIIINNLVCLCSSAPSNTVRNLVNNNLKTLTPQTPSSDNFISPVIIDNIKSNNKIEEEKEQNFNSVKINENFTVPQNMQWKRFMWKEVDETMDNIAHGVAEGAKAMSKMIDNYINISPMLNRQKKAVNSYYHGPASSTNVKYVIKSPLKRSKIIKLPSSGPRKIVKIISPSSLAPHYEALTKSSSSSSLPRTNLKTVNNFGYLDDIALREIEKKEEEKVEATISAILPNYAKEEQITFGKFSNSDDGWKPVTSPSSSPFIESETLSSFIPISSKPVSSLHTKTSDLPLEKPIVSSYEVTENSAEETIIEPYTFTPRKYAIKSTNLRGPSTISSIENFVIHKTQINNSSETLNGDISNSRNYQQSNKIPSSYSSVIYNSHNIENNINKPITTSRSIFSTKITDQEINPSRIPIALKKTSGAIATTTITATKEIPKIGGYKRIQDSQKDHENYTFTTFPSDQKKNKQEQINVRNRGSKKFGDKLQ